MSIPGGMTGKESHGAALLQVDSPHPTPDVTRRSGGSEARTQGHHKAAAGQQGQLPPQLTWLQPQLSSCGNQAHGLPASASQIDHASQPVLTYALPSPHESSDPGRTTMMVPLGPQTGTSAWLRSHEGQLLGSRAAVAEGAAKPVAPTMVRKAAWWETPLAPQTLVNISSQQHTTQSVSRQPSICGPEPYQRDTSSPQQFSSYFSIFECSNISTTGAAELCHFPQQQQPHPVPSDGNHPSGSGGEVVRGAGSS